MWTEKDLTEDKALAISCNECEEKFSNPSALKIHERTHNGENHSVVLSVTTNAHIQAL